MKRGGAGGYINLCLFRRTCSAFSPTSMASEDFYLHSLLLYNQYPVVPGHCCPLLWDLRQPPDSARRVLSADQPITPFHLSRLATNPPTAILHVTCEVFPGEWPIEVRRLEGITVGDILGAIHTTLMHPIRRQEWDQLSEKQRSRIKVAFDERCKTADDRDECHSRGILRVDCLLQHTLFAGLYVSLIKDCSCILILRRPPKFLPANMVET